MLFLFSLCSDLCFPPLEEEVQKTRQGTRRQNSTSCCLLVVILCRSTGRARELGLQAGTSQRDSGLIFLLFNQSNAKTPCERGLPLSSMIQSNCACYPHVFSRKFNMKEYREKLSLGLPPWPTSCATKKTYEFHDHEKLLIITPGFFPL